jgi:hypothetical protein
MTADESLARPEAETKDAHPLMVGSIGASLALIIGLGLLGGKLIVGHGDFESEKLLRGPRETFEHGPLAASDIDRSWAEINRTLASEANGYAWIDRRAGIVRVPIGRAIDLICAEQGRPIGNGAERQEPP